LVVHPGLQVGDRGGVPGWWPVDRRGGPGIRPDGVGSTQVSGSGRDRHRYRPGL